MAHDQPSGEAASPVEVALAGGSPLRTGWFRFYFADERWEWSAEVEQMHGYEPGSVTPTTELVMAHKHPDDYHKMAAILDHVRRTHQAISTGHRIVDAHGRTVDVVVVGQQLHDDAGEVIGTHGFYVDGTPAGRAFLKEAEEAQQEAVSEAVAEIAENRGAIEQVKGMLMLIYRIDADNAFELFRWRSQEANVKLRSLAEQLASDFLALSYDDTLPTRSTFDQLLLTAHLRIAGDEEHNVAS
jgi:hypothetical protein